MLEKLEYWACGWAVGLLCGALLMVFSFPASAQGKEQLPTGKQYLVGQLAAAEAKVSDMLDEIATLRKQLDALHEMMAKRDEPKK